GLERLRAGLVGRPFGERVLDHPEARVSLAQAGSQLGHLGHGDAPVVDRQDRLRSLYLGGDLGDRRGLLLTVHLAPSPVLCARLRGAGGLWWAGLALSSYARRGRLL